MFKLIYNKNSTEAYINIFGSDFVKNNAKRAKIIINNKIKNIVDKISIHNLNKQKIIIYLLIYSNKINGYSMFKNCTALEEIKELSQKCYFNDNKKYFNNITPLNEGHIFSSNIKKGIIFNKEDCSEEISYIEKDVTYNSYGSFSNLEINHLNTKNNSSKLFRYSIGQMFRRCSSLKSLLDISNLNTKDFIDLSYLFEDCSSLISIPDISNWNIKNVITDNRIFLNFSKLTKLSDISKWDFSNITDIDALFCNFSSLLSLPDLSKLDTSNVIYIRNCFENCKSLISLPDISKWNTKNFFSMQYMFAGCPRLLSVPDISKWNTENCIFFNGLFSDCSSLISLPDISK